MLIAIKKYPTIFRRVFQQGGKRNLYFQNYSVLP